MGEYGRKPMVAAVPGSTPGSYQPKAGPEPTNFVGGGGYDPRQGAPGPGPGLNVNPNMNPGQNIAVPYTPGTNNTPGGAGPLINPAAPAGSNYGQPGWWPTRNLQDPGFTPDPWAADRTLRNPIPRRPEAKKA